MFKKIILSIMLASAALFSVQGCRTSSSTTRSEKVTVENGHDASFDHDNLDNGHHNVEETRISEKTTETEHRGILGSTVHFVGQVLAFPFKVVVAVIELIF